MDGQRTRQVDEAARVVNRSTSAKHFSISEWREFYRDADSHGLDLDDLRKAHPGGIVICVSHADPIKAAVAHAMGTHLDLFQRIVISTCSVSAVSYSAHGPVVLTVNSTGGDLADLQIS